jgi:amino acid transporter
VLSGIISTVVIIVYWFFADNAAEMFWQVTAFCLVVELLSYLVLFPAYIVLRQRDKNIGRPYRVPGPDWCAFLLAGVAEAALLLTVVILCVQPGKDFLWTALPIIVGSISCVIVGELLISYSLKRSKHEAAA